MMQVTRRIALGLILLAEILLFTSDTHAVRPVPTIVTISTQVIEPIENVLLSSEIAKEPLDTSNELKDIDPNDDIIHIILAGVDSGDTGFDHGRTDSIILVSLDPIGEKIKLTSFMRDLYVEIPGHGYSKINAAHAWGGMALLKDTLRLNFGLSLDRHVVIDFTGFQSAIDIIGGVDLEIKDYEVPHVNTTGPGVQHLNGSQALHYVRLRYAGNSDYERTERQRRLLAAVLQKVREHPASDYYRLYREVEPYIRTNFSILETLRIGYISYILRDAEVETLRIPVDGAYVSTYVQEMAVLIPDLEANIAALNAFLRPAQDQAAYPRPIMSIEPSR